MRLIIKICVLTSNCTNLIFTHMCKSTGKREDRRRLYRTENCTNQYLIALHATPQGQSISAVNRARSAIGHWFVVSAIKDLKSRQSFSRGVYIFENQN
jgi:hypothetical protein